jgi:hypothetical protein
VDFNPGILSELLMIWLRAAVPFSQIGFGLPQGHPQRTGSAHFLSVMNCGFHALECGFLLDSNRKASAMQDGQGARRHPAPSRAADQWLARKAPEVVASDGFRPSVEPQSLRVPSEQAALHRKLRGRFLRKWAHRPDKIQGVRVVPPCTSIPRPLHSFSGSVPG